MFKFVRMATLEREEGKRMMEKEKIDLRSTLRLKEREKNNALVLE